MPTTAKVICDSINPDGDRLTTMELEMPRYILAEFNTHRMFSRCTASSRAIPVEKRIAMLINDPVIPHWGVNKPGMQADEVADKRTASEARNAWLEARDWSVHFARELVEMGIHKQAVNRLLEPFVHVKTIVSATEWANFFALRCHPKAAPEMQALANAMKEAYLASTPSRLGWDIWHLPFITEKEKYETPFEIDYELVYASVARCARVSYNNHDGSAPDIKKDVELYKKLVGAYPRHASATEHAAFACEHGARTQAAFDYNHDHANFVGWHQHRKQIPDENITKLPWES